MKKIIIHYPVTDIRVVNFFLLTTLVNVDTTLMNVDQHALSCFKFVDLNLS